MREKTLDSQKIKENGWKQGACLLVNEATKIDVIIQDTRVHLKAGLYIVLSQNCDILNDSLEKEPVIEVVLTESLEKCNTEFTAGRNVRQLQLEQNGGAAYLEVFPYKRCFISRTYLEALKAEEITISEQSLKILVGWLTKRYKRPGFPHEFNKRIKPIVKEIKKILSSEAENSLGLFIRLSSEEELNPSKIYSVLVKMLVKKDTYELQSELLKIEKGFNQILSVLSKVKGINIIEGSQVQSLDDITIHRYQELKQWDFDYISFLNGEEGNTIAD